MSKGKSYSYSRLDLYGNCPHAYKVIYLDKVPRTPSEALLTGQNIHELVAAYLSRLIQTKTQTDWTWAESAAANHSEDVQEIWARFWNSFVMPPAEAPAVELKMAFTKAWKPTEWFAKDAYFRLVIDFTFRQGALAVVQDWKSGRFLPATVEKDLQLRIYGWAVRRAVHPEAQEVLLRLHFLRYGQEREVLLNPADLDTVPAELEERIRWIEGDDHFDPTPGSFCSWCGVQAHCPVMSGALVPVEVMAPATREQAEKAALLLLTMEEMGKVLKEKLKAWVKENGDIAVGDMVYGPVATTSYDLDTETVVNRLLEAGIDRQAVWPLLSLTKTSLEKGLKKLKRQELLQEILAGSPLKEGEQVKFHKAK